MNQQSVFVCFVLTIVTLSVPIWCSSNDLDIDFDKIKEKLPEGVVIPETLKNITLPSMDDAKKVLQEKCRKVSGSDAAYEAIEQGAERLKNCTSGLIDVEQLQKEIEAAQPNGELDTVFNKYCRKRNIAIECMQNFTEVVEQCLEPKEIEGQKTFVKIFTNLLNFVCHKDGDQIALFIAEKGPECFNERKEDLITCINATFFNYMPSEKDVEAKELPITLPQLVMGAEQCDDMDKLQQCVVKSLEKCEESTPANLVDSMFKFVRNETPCVNLTSTTAKQRQTSTTGGSYRSLASSTLLATAFMFITVRSLV